MAPRRKSVAERFWPKVRRSGGCWEWTAGVMGIGYGKFMWEPGRDIGAHRASYMLHFGTIPPGLDVCHVCDNPRCVRPDHLFVGTRTDNMRDALRKGRTRFVPLRGEMNGRAKITGIDATAIRERHAAGETHRELARVYGVTAENIYHIVARRTWKNVA